MVFGRAGTDLRHLLFDLFGLLGNALQATAGGLDLLRRLLQLDALALDMGHHRRALLADIGGQLTAA